MGTRFDGHADGSITLSQPKMIEWVLKIVGLDPDSERTKLHDIPASEHKLLDNDPDGLERIQKWNYRSAVRCLSYIQAMIRPDITMSVQQCARFCNKPKREHEEAVKRICRYLLKPKIKVLPLNRTRLEVLNVSWMQTGRDHGNTDLAMIHCPPTHKLDTSLCTQDAPLYGHPRCNR
jgi:hypothetical protein